MYLYYIMNNTNTNDTNDDFLPPPPLPRLVRQEGVGILDGQIFQTLDTIDYSSASDDIKKAKDAARNLRAVVALPSAQQINYADAREEFDSATIRKPSVMAELRELRVANGVQGGKRRHKRRSTTRKRKGGSKRKNRRRKSRKM